MPSQKKQVKKVEQTENKPKTFSAFVIQITERNDLVVLKGEKQERVVIAHVDLPRYDRKENKEECFAYETGEFLRKKLVGKNVKFEVFSEYNGIAQVVPTVGNENIVASLLSLGFADLREGKGKKNETYVKAVEAAIAEKKGIYNENPQKLCKKRPEDPKMTPKELDFLVNKEVKGFIRKVEAPASFIIETPERKFFRMGLEGVNQHAPFLSDEGKFKLDAIANEAIKYVEKVFGYKDCTVKIVENGKKVRGVVKVGDKDVAEHLLLNGYVTLSIRGDSPLKEQYEKAEQTAQNEKKGRFADEGMMKEFKEKKEQKAKAIGDRIKNAKTITGFVKFIGKFIRIEKEDKSEVEVKLASVIPRYKKDDAQFNKNVEFRMREIIRKQIAGKKVECKHAYTLSIEREGKKINDEYYDVYANGKNIALQLLREGVCVLDNKTQNELKQSFDYAEFKKTQTKEFKVVPVTEYTATNIANVKDAFIDQSVFQCAIEKVISLTKYLIYVPSKESTLTINLKGITVPRAGKECEEFVDKARNVLTKLILYQDATVTFVDFFKGILYAEVNVKGVGEISTFLTEKGYAIPTGKVVLSAEVEEMKNAKENIYQFVAEQKPKKEEEEEKKPRRIVEAKFGPEEKVYMTGYDGENVYYYVKKEEAEFIEALSNEIKGIKKGKYELKVGKGYAVEIKGKMYRAEILSVSNGANVVKCVDTGATYVIGKNKIRTVPEEITKREVKVLSKKLIAIKPLSVKDTCYKTMLETAAAFYEKEVSMFISNDEAKVVVGDVCFNVHMIEQGLSLIDRRFHDKGEFGAQLKAAEGKAKENHTNAWQYGEIFDEEDKERN